MAIRIAVFENQFEPFHSDFDMKDALLQIFLIVNMTLPYTNRKLIELFFLRGHSNNTQHSKKFYIEFFFCFLNILFLKLSEYYFFLSVLFFHYSFNSSKQVRLKKTVNHKKMSQGLGRVEKCQIVTHNLNGP